MILIANKNSKPVNKSFVAKNKCMKFDMLPLVIKYENERYTQNTHPQIQLAQLEIFFL